MSYQMLHLIHSIYRTLHLILESIYGEFLLGQQGNIAICLAVAFQEVFHHGNHRSTSRYLWESTT